MSSRGASKVTVLIFGSIFAVVGFLAWQIIPYFYYYHELQNQMYAMARRGQVLTDAEIKKRLLKDMKKMQIPADPDDLEIIRGDKSMEISLSYDEVLSIEFNGKEYELYTFEFDAYVNEPFVGNATTMF